MTTRVGINGFGRMGRLALRAAWGWPEIDFAHINEAKGGNEVAAHLFAFDSVHGRWKHEVATTSSGIRIGTKEIPVSSRPPPGGLKLKEVLNMPHQKQ